MTRPDTNEPPATQPPPYVSPTTGTAPDVFKPAGPRAGGQAWAALIEQLDYYEPRLRDEDPYVAAAAFTGRARVYEQIQGQTDDPVYKQACFLASLHDHQAAAKIRFQHGIPTIFPGTEIALLDLRRCEFCGRPWQIDPDGERHPDRPADQACPHCPRLMHGPTPSTMPAAAGMPSNPVDVTRFLSPPPEPD